MLMCHGNCVHQLYSDITSSWNLALYKHRNIFLWMELLISEIIYNRTYIDLINIGVHYRWIIHLTDA